jgi:hypothetical protein
MRKTNRATQFSVELTSALAERRAFGLKWHKNWGIEDTRETIDVVGLQKGIPRMFIEVELRRQNPSSNVIKIWKAIEDGDLPGRKILLVQAFSKIFHNRGKARQKELADFVGRKMSEQLGGFRYVQVPFPYNPQHGGLIGGGARKKQARRLVDILIADKSLKRALGHQ